MKALLLSLGTRGDIEPFLAIAELLKEHNWDVVCVFPEQFRSTTEQMGISFRGFDKAFLELLNAKDGKEFMGGKGSVVKRIGILIRLSIQGMKLSRGIVALQHETLINEKPDKVLYHPKCNIALLWGMGNLGKSIMVSPMPGMAHPIDEHTIVAGNLGKHMNRMFYGLVNFAKAVAIKMMARKYKKDYPAAATTISGIKKVMLEKETTFYTSSPSLFTRPPSWPACAKVVGYYERNKELNWVPGDELSLFLKRYANPVFITFGSMSTPNPEKKTDAIIRVLTRRQIPCIINTSWGGLKKPESYPEHIHFVEDIPYDWLFPRLYAVVHHGGAGTTHTAVKYACPSLVIPHAVDQFFWGETISSKGLGPKSLPIKEFSETLYESRLVDLIQNKLYKQNARILSERMKQETDREMLYHLISTPEAC